MFFLFSAFFGKLRLSDGRFVSVEKLKIFRKTTHKQHFFKDDEEDVVHLYCWYRWTEVLVLDTFNHLIKVFSGCAQSSTASHVVEHQLSLQHNIVRAYRMRVSQPVNLCVHARGHVTVFIQHLVFFAEILSLSVAPNLWSAQRSGVFNAFLCFCIFLPKIWVFKILVHAIEIVTGYRSWFIFFVIIFPDRYAWFSLAEFRFSWVDSFSATPRSLRIWAPVPSSKTGCARHSLRNCVDHLAALSHVCATLWSEPGLW